MSSSSAASAKGAKILCMRFNQINSCVAVGTTRGYRIYNCVPFAKGYDSYEGGAGLVEMLFNTSLVSLVGAGEQPSFSPRRLRMWNSKTEKEICDLNFVYTVVNVKLNRTRLVALLENKLHLFDLKTMKILHTIDTVPNPSGVIALSPSTDNCFMAFPSSETKGEIVIYDALNLQVTNQILAHDAPVRLLAFNPDGTLLATVSNKGTVVRVWSIPDGKKLFTFRRGSYEAVVNSLSFNSTSTLIALSSAASNTVHIFSLVPDKQGNSPASSGSGSGGSVTPPGSSGRSSGGVSPPLSNGKSDPLSPNSASAAASPTAASSSSLASAGGASSASTMASAAMSGMSSAAASIGSAVSTHGSKLLRLLPSSLLPNALTNYMDPTRHFARAILKDGSQVCGIGMLGADTLLVITLAGHLFRYHVPSAGGDCKLEAEHTLLDNPSEIIGVKFMTTNTAVAPPTAAATAAVATAPPPAAAASDLGVSVVFPAGGSDDLSKTAEPSPPMATSKLATATATATAATTAAGDSKSAARTSAPSKASPATAAGGFMDTKYSAPPSQPHSAASSASSTSHGSSNGLHATAALALTATTASPPSSNGTPSPAAALPSATATPQPTSSSSSAAESATSHAHGGRHGKGQGRSPSTSVSGSSATASTASPAIPTASASNGLNGHSASTPATNVWQARAAAAATATAGSSHDLKAATAAIADDSPAPATAHASHSSHSHAPSRKGKGGKSHGAASSSAAPAPAPKSLAPSSFVVADADDDDPTPVTTTSSLVVTEDD